MMRTRVALLVLVAFLAAGCASTSSSTSAPTSGQPTSGQPTSGQPTSGQPTTVSGRYVPPVATRTQSCVETNGLPDVRCTPGATNPAVTQANIHSTICVSGYTKTVRPPVSYTEPLKRLDVAAYGLSGGLKPYELDHLIPLEVGGNPTSHANLWPEPWDGPAGAHAKDVVENRLHRAVCDGTMSLAAAQKIFATNWKAG